MYYLKRALSGVSVVGTALVTFFGLWQIIDYVNKEFQNSLVTAALSCGMLILIVMPFVLTLSRPLVLREFGLPRYSSRRLCLKHSRRTTINDEYRASVAETQRWVFLEKPQPEDLVDIHSIDPSLSLEDFQYISDDAVETERLHVSRFRLAVRWRPRKPIEKYTEYVHNQRYEPPVSYDAPACYSEYHCALETGEFESLVEYPDSVEKVVVFLRPRFWSLGDDLTFMEFTFRSARRRFGEIEFSDSCRAFTWRLALPIYGRSYVCVFFRRGGVDEWQRRLRSEGSFARLKRRAINLIKSVIPS